MHAGSSDLLVRAVAEKNDVSSILSERATQHNSALVCLVGGHPGVSEEHAAGDGHSRNLPQPRFQDKIL